MNVFTYGSLMYPTVWDRVAHGRYPSTMARVRGYRRHGVRDETYPAAVPSTQAIDVQGASREALIVGRVYFDVAAADVARLDAFETNDYERATVAAELLESVRLEPVPVQSTSLQSMMQPHAVGLVAGASVPADLYVYRFTERLLAQDWDPEWFEREGIHRFIATYCARHGSG